MDVRGHGLSGKPHDTAQYGVEMVEDVRRLLDHLKIEKAHLVGYSMGGFIVYKFMALHPERLITAMPCGAAWMEPGIRWNSSPTTFIGGKRRPAPMLRGLARCAARWSAAPRRSTSIWTPWHTWRRRFPR